MLKIFCPVLFLWYACYCIVPVQCQAKLSQQELLFLVQLQIRERAIIAFVRENGVAFKLDADSEKKLQSQGVSAKILAAIKEKIARDQEQLTVTKILQLFSVKTPQAQILAIIDREQQLPDYSVQDWLTLRRKLPMLITKFLRAKVMGTEMALPEITLEEIVSWHHFGLNSDACIQLLKKREIAAAPVDKIDFLHQQGVAKEIVRYLLMRIGPPKPQGKPTCFRGDVFNRGYYVGNSALAKPRCRWKVKTGGGVYSSPAIHDKVVYFGSNDGNFYAIEANNGDEKWTFKTEGKIISSPAVVAGYVYFGSCDSRLYALDLNDGKQLWSYATGDAIYGSPLVIDNTVYFGSQDGHFYAIDAGNGKIKWKFATKGGIYSSAAADEGIVYFGSKDGFLYALGMENGSRKWRFVTGHEVISSPAIANRIVYVGSRDTYLYAIYARTGVQKWKFKTNWPVISSPAIAESVIYCGSFDNHIYAIDAIAGKQKWKFKTNAWVGSSPSIVAGMLYCGSLDGYLYALNAHNGQLQWKFKTSSWVGSSPVVTGNRIYFTGRDSYLYALTAIQVQEMKPSVPATADNLSAIMVLQGIRCKSSKANGKKWDWAWGKASLPDVFVEIFIQEKRKWRPKFTSSVVKDQLHCHFKHPTAIIVTPGTKIKVIINDKDLRNNDVIGIHIFDISTEDLQKQSRKLSFGQVEELQLSFRKK